jgi:hypothetical protein
MKDKLVSFGVSGLNSSEFEWEDVKEKYPIGEEIHFGFKVFSEGGIPQSANIYRGD